MTSWSDSSQEPTGLSELDKTGMAATITHILQPSAGKRQPSQIGYTDVIMKRGTQKTRSDLYKGDKKKTGVYCRSSAPSRLCITEKDSKQNEKCKTHVSWSKEKAAVALPKENIIFLRRFLRAIKDFDGVVKELKEAISYTKEECISDESSRVLDCIGDLSSIVRMLEKKIQDVLQRSISEEMSTDILMEQTKASERIKEEINLCQKNVGLCLEMTQKVQKDDAEFQELIECKEILQMDEMIACYENLKNMVISLQQAIERDRNELEFTANSQQELHLMIQAKIRENETLRQSNVKFLRDIKAKEQKIKDMLHKLSSLQHSATNKDIRVNVAAQTTSGLKLAIAEKNIQIIKLQKDMARYKSFAEKEQVKSKRLTKEKIELENKLHDTLNTLFGSTSAPLNKFKMTSLSNEVITLKKSVEEKNKTFQAMMNAKAELELQLSTLQKEVEQKNETIANLENVIKNNRCNYEEVSSLKETLEQLRKTVAEKDEIIKSLECDFDKLRKENEKRIQDISLEKVAELEEERDALQTTVKMLEKTLLNSTTEKETKCTEEQQLIEKVSRFEHEVAVIAKERDFLRNENSILLQEVENSIVERNKLRNQFSEVETARCYLSSELDILQAKRAKEEKIRTEQEQKIQELNDKADKQRQNQQDLKLEGNRFQKDKGDTERNQREKIRVLEKERNGLMDEKLNIGKQLSENNKIISDLREALAVSRSNILKLGQMIKNLRMEVAASSHERQYLQGNIISLKESLARKKQERKALEESASKIKEENQMIQKIIEAMKEENERIKEENETIKEENETIKEENETIKEENETIKEENETIKEENETIKEENKLIKEENERIKEENERIKEDNDTIKDEIKALNLGNLKKQVLESYSDRKQKQQRESETQTADTMEFQINASSEKPESFYKRVPNLDNDSEDYLDKCHDLEMALSQKKKELRKMAVQNFLLKEFTYMCVTHSQERMATLECLDSDEEEMIMEMEKDAQEQTIGSSKEDLASNFTKQKDDIQAPVCVLEDAIKTLQVELLKKAEETENLSTEMFKLREQFNPIVCNNERLMNLTVERKVIMDNIRSLEDVIKKCEDSMGADDIVQERIQLVEAISMLQQRLRTENENIKKIMNQRNAFLEELQTAMSEVEEKKEIILSIEREKDELSVNLSVCEDQLLKTNEAWKKESEEKEKCKQMFNFSKGILTNIAQWVDQGKSVFQGDLAVA